MLILSIEEIIDCAYFLIYDGLLDPCILEVLFTLIVESLALPLLVMKSLSDLIDHILVETSLKWVHEIALVLSLFDQLLKVLLGGLLVLSPPVGHHLIQKLILFRPEASALLLASLAFLCLVLDLLENNLVLQLLAGLFLDHHLTDNVRIDSLLITNHRVLEVLRLSTLGFLFITQLVFKTFPGPIKSASHLVCVFYLIRVVWSQIGTTRGRRHWQEILSEL